MALQAQLKTEVEIKSTNADKLYNIFRKHGYLVPEYSPKHFKGVDLLEGSWDKSGAIKLLKYTADGTLETFKTTTEFDDEHKIMAHVGLGGDIMKLYSVCKINFKIIPKGENCLVEVTIQYKKSNKDVPALDKYLEFLVSFLMDIGVRLGN